jgi:hypothetical protein
MTESDGVDDPQLEDKLRRSLTLMAPPATSTGVLQKVHLRVSRRRRRMREVFGGALVVLVGGGTVVGLALSTGPQMSAAPPAHGLTSPGRTPPTSTTASGASASTNATGRASAGDNSGSLSARPPTPTPCPTDQLTPTMASGSFCGPAPMAGNGLGPSGTCDGRETDPPCGPGVVPGRFYAYTVPGTCSGLLDFDGKQWVSELPPPNPVPAFDVWIQLSADGSVRWIAPTGSAGLIPYTGQTLTQCRG